MHLNAYMLNVLGIEFNPYIYTLSKLSRFGYEISVFKYTTGWYSEQPPEQPAHTSRNASSWKNGCQNFSYVHRRRKHWECKYLKYNTESDMISLYRTSNTSQDLV